VLKDAASQNTRFVACAQLGNADKQKFVYAFNITPMKELSKTEVRFTYTSSLATS